MGFTLPLSLLVIYDSYIHSGSVPVFLRERFSERPPVNGGDEKAWITAYINVRYSWLKTNPKVVLQGTVYRPQCMKDQIAANNWALHLPVNAHGVLVA